MTPKKAFLEALRLGKGTPELEDIISKSARFSYEYALDVLKLSDEEAKKWGEKFKEEK